MIRLAVVADSPLVQAGLEALVAGDADVQIVRGSLTAVDDGASVSPWERAAALGPDEPAAAAGGGTGRPLRAAG